jgi:hypothetical protein
MYLTKVDKKTPLNQTVALQLADWMLAPHYPSRNWLARPKSPVNICRNTVVLTINH